jgi:murein DD-endopeptidase MepM/ murein hydrolase activator NlpD
LKSGRDKITILIVPEGEGESRSYRLSRNSVRFIICSLFILLLAIIAGAISYFPLLDQALKYKALEAKNLKLENENQRITKLAQDLQKLQEYHQKVSRAMGISPKIDSVSLNADTAITQEQNKPSTGLLSPSPPVKFEAPVTGQISNRYESGQFPKISHPALDYAVPEGSLVKASASGWVIFKGWDFRYGNWLIIQHPNDYTTYYGHNRAILVQVGEKISAGQLVAISGNSGRSTAPHLHFEIRHRGEPLNPEKLLQ